MDKFGLKEIGHLCRLEVAAHSEGSQQQDLEPSGPPGARPDTQASNGQPDGLLSPGQLQRLPAPLQEAHTAEQKIEIQGTPVCLT